MNLETIGQLTEGMKKQAQELIYQAYTRGYNVGYEEGKGQAWSEEIKKYEIEPDKEREYIEQGRNEAWEAARKLVSAGYKECNEILDDGVLSIETDDEIFVRCTASEAIEKIREWEKKQEKYVKFHIGDEVIYDGDKWIVVREEYAFGMNIPTVSVMVWNGCFIASVKVSDIKKTGRTFPQISEVLEKLKEESE